MLTVIFAVYVWITLRLFQAVDSHSGYGTFLYFSPSISNFLLTGVALDFPWSLQHIIPFWSGAEHHDFHHMAFVNNFSTSFRWFDWAFGTDTKYREYRAKIKAAKKAGLSLKDLAALEKRMSEQAEREGVEAEKVAESYTYFNSKSKVA